MRRIASLVLSIAAAGVISSPIAAQHRMAALLLYQQTGEPDRRASREDEGHAREARLELERCERDRQRMDSEVRARAANPGQGGLFLPMFARAMIDITCRERQQQAAATDQAIERTLQSRQIGQSVEWTSEERPGVRGSSTVTAIEADAQYGDCMTVTDIVIVDGQETRAPKRMCRRPPSNRYVRVS